MSFSKILILKYITTDIVFNCRVAFRRVCNLNLVLCRLVAKSKQNPKRAKVRKGGRMHAPKSAMEIGGEKRKKGKVVEMEIKAKRNVTKSAG